MEFITLFIYMYILYNTASSLFNFFLRFHEKTATGMTFILNQTQQLDSHLTTANQLSVKSNDKEYTYVPTGILVPQCYDQ